MQTLPTFSQLIEDGMLKFVELLSKSEPQFLSESSVHQLRKKTLEIMQRTNPLQNVIQSINYEQRLALTRDVLTLVYQLIDKENEENVMICFKIIIDYHRYLKNTVLINEVFHKQFSQRLVSNFFIVSNFDFFIKLKVQKFFNFVKNMYRDLAANTNLVFGYKPQMKVHDLSEINQERILNETYSSFQIIIEKANNKEGQIVGHILFYPLYFYFYILQRWNWKKFSVNLRFPQK